MSVSIRTLTAADVDVADVIFQAAYGGPSRKQRLQLYLRLQPDGWLLAALDGEPAGVAGATNYGPIGHIGMVAVDPAKQRRGVALAMMEQLLDWFDRWDCPVILLDASEAGAPLYRKLGFVEDEKTLGFILDACTLPLQLSERVSPLRAEDIAELIAFDEPIFGAARPAALAALLDESPERAFVIRDTAGGISGSLFAQTLTRGPGAARPPADAEALLVAALRLPFEGAPGALVP